MTENEIISYVKTCEYGYRAQVISCCERILSQRELKYIALCGPSCSGKTTTAKIMTEYLNDRGLEVNTVSIDNFFYPRNNMIEKARITGEPLDMDSVKAIDLDLLSSFVNDIENGKKAKMPIYDFTLGYSDTFEEITPGENTVFLFEGIQAFYPEVSALFPENEIIKIYISVISDIKIGQREFDAPYVRLLRRVLRDYKFRDTSPSQTLKHWENVRSNELLHIHPHKKTADVVIDSSIPYGLNVMKKELSELLLGVDTPYSDDLRFILENTFEIDRKYVPKDSMLREFIG